MKLSLLTSSSKPVNRASSRPFYPAPTKSVIRPQPFFIVRGLLFQVITPPRAAKVPIM
ncbi:MAG: hypothetical protein JWM16_4575, partial [Verrucomicrobiales bacterium]|nr:hypothetical protein [Verrucomicrobiales bacterium]